MKDKLFKDGGKKIIEGAYGYNYFYKNISRGSGVTLLAYISETKIKDRIT